ncbi:SDR family oxidoreductase [Streptomyces sp. NPDC048428]|uniref:NAD-dependent epimerase/dehydratase family protein n=1 Tax=Streptomyces sp. NPDC048428 TaxID=3154503 RepID=UPI003422AF13
MRTRILITGGGGYVGSALVKRLAEGGEHDVVVVDSGLTSGRTEGEPGVSYVRADVRDCGDWAHELAGVDNVVHLAAVVGDPACSLAPQLAWEVNYLGTVRLAEACRRAGVGRFVFASTCSNYGISGSDPAEVTSPLYPQSVYAASKVQAEHHLLVNRDEHFTPFILRFATLYGLAPRMRFDLAVNVMTGDAVHKGRVTVHGGRQWRPFLHVQDAAKAIHLALAADRTTITPQVYNCGPLADGHQIIDVARLIAAEVPGTELVMQDTVTDSRDYRVDFSRIHRDLDFSAGLRVVDGIREIKGRLDAGDFKDYAEAPYSDLLALTESLHRKDPASDCRTGRTWPHLTRTTTA